MLLCHSAGPFDLLFGVGQGANIKMAADETHVSAGFTLLIFVLKDVVSELVNHRRTLRRPDFIRGSARAPTPTPRSRAGSHPGEHTIHSFSPMRGALVCIGQWRFASTHTRAAPARRAPVACEPRPQIWNQIPKKHFPLPKVRENVPPNPNRPSKLVKLVRAS